MSEEVLFSPHPKQEQFIEAIFSDKYSFLIFGGAMGGGKLLRLDEPIPTPLGWTTMGALNIGDKIFDANGKPCTVTALSEIEHNPDSYELFFDDGYSIQCDTGHQWVTTTAKERERISHSLDSYREKRKLWREKKKQKE